MITAGFIFTLLSVAGVAGWGYIYLHRRQCNGNYLPRAKAVLIAMKDALMGHVFHAMLLAVTTLLDLTTLFGIVFVSWCGWAIVSMIIQVKRVADTDKNCEVCVGTASQRS